MIVCATTDGPYRDPCLRILEAVAVRDADGRTSAAVLEEVWYVERSGKAGRIDGLAASASTIFTPLLPVTDEAFGLALSLRAADLGPADRLHAGTCPTHAVDVIVTADAAFSQIRGLCRVDPLDARALDRLLAT